MSECQTGSNDEELKIIDNMCREGCNKDLEFEWGPFGQAIIGCSECCWHSIIGSGNPLTEELQTLKQSYLELVEGLRLISNQGGRDFIDIDGKMKCVARTTLQNHAELIKKLEGGE